MPSCTEVRNPKAEGQKLTGRCAGHGGTIKPQRWSSPSPREGRAGRGVRSILNDAVEYLSGTPLSLALPMSFDSPASCRRFSLSPSEGERAGVRGPSWGSGGQSAPVGRGGLSPLVPRGEREPTRVLVVPTRCARTSKGERQGGAGGGRFRRKLRTRLPAQFFDPPVSFDLHMRQAG